MYVKVLLTDKVDNPLNTLTFISSCVYYLADSSLCILIKFTKYLFEAHCIQFEHMSKCQSDSSLKKLC